MLFPPTACTILNTWNTTGLAGTGSHDFVIENVFVPFEESCSFVERPYCTTPLYRFAPLFLVSHAGVPLGLARAAIDAVIELAQSKPLIPDPHKVVGSRMLREDSRAHEAVAIAEGHDLVSLEMLVAAVSQVIAAFLRRRGGTVTVDDGEIQSPVLMKLAHRAGKKSGRYSHRPPSAAVPDKYACSESRGGL